MEPVTIDLNGEVELRIRFGSVRRVSGDQYTVGFEVYGLHHDNQEQLFVELRQEVPSAGDGLPKVDEVVYEAAQTLIWRLSKLGSALSCQYPKSRPPQ